jgi:hypothetical protein
MNKETKIAIAQEINGQYLEAVKSYEELLKNSSTTSLEAYVNLAFLYWEFASEFTFNEVHKIPGTWSEIGGKRYPIILEHGLNIYPNSVELHFWKRYFSHILFGDEFTKQDCEFIIQRYGITESLVPYFFLYLFDNLAYQGYLNTLLKECDDFPTAKNIYIKSVVGNPPAGADLQSVPKV